MFAETEINLVNGLAAIALGFGLLVLVAWVDRRYLQKYEEVQSAEEEKKSKAEKPFIDEAVTEESELPSGSVGTVPAAATTVVSSNTADAISWKNEGASTVEPLPTMLPPRKSGAPDAKPASQPAAKHTTSEPHKRQPKKAAAEAPAASEPAQAPTAKAAAPAKAPTPDAETVTTTAETTTGKKPDGKVEPATGKKPDDKAEPATGKKPDRQVEPAPSPQPAKTPEPVASEATADAPADPLWEELPTVARGRARKPAKPAEPTGTAPVAPKPEPSADPIDLRNQPGPAAAVPRSARARAAGKPAPEPVAVTTTPEPKPAGTDRVKAKPEPAPVAAAPVPKRAVEEPTVLPKGAEAALASILEVVPDPRNTIALTRDPTAEVRLTKADKDQAITSSGQPRGDYEPPAPNDDEWDTPKEPAASDRLAASPDPAHR